MKQKRCKKYDALGFVEALIAIVVAGSAALVLMGLAADTIAQVTRNERSDEMTQIAIEGGSVVKAIAEKNNSSETTEFPKIDGNVNSCFALDSSSANPSFVKNGENISAICNYDAGQRENCKSALAAGYTDLFQVFCITSSSDIPSGVVVGKIIVGKVPCASSEDCDIQDYQYYVLVKTEQK